MVLSASGKGCAYQFREAFRSIKKILELAGMRLNKTKCVVVANTDACRHECRRAWNRMGVDVGFTTRNLGVDVQWGPWRNPVQLSRIKSFTAAMSRVQDEHDPGAVSACHLYGSEVSGLAATSSHRVRVSARGALGRGAQLRRAAELELALTGGIKADPQVTLDLYTIRAWQRAQLTGHEWRPTEEGFVAPRGSVRWEDADYYVVLASHCKIMADVVARRPDFQGLERGLDGPTIKAMRKLAGQKDHTSRSILNAACGGLWMNDRRSR
eukprot:2093546-Amphidinium_carterae.1